jgi:hypothetical protein
MVLNKEHLSLVGINQISVIAKTINKENSLTNKTGSKLTKGKFTPSSK